MSLTIVLTNDDGIGAPGLVALASAAACLGGRLVVVAPTVCHSGGAHRVTTDRPLVVHTIGPDRYAVDGTPADCTRVALAVIVPEASIVLSGINAGGNLGIDTHHSGTVAAAREAALHGRRAIAASQYRRGTEINWQQAEAWLVRVLGLLETIDLAPGEFWNVNLPDPPQNAAGDHLEPAVVECPVDPSPLGLGFRETSGGWQYSARYHDRPRVAGGDVDVCFGGRIALSRCRVV
ncbi:MAG: 5'/3'-nucleotidase SurE [Planctomycetota bacterium]|nr:MAG: 5'/3'-nucleotidase SurE [Planctomycetota bacterium]